jgi:hypothetical protein
MSRSAAIASRPSRREKRSLFALKGIVPRRTWGDALADGRWRLTRWTTEVGSGLWAVRRPLIALTGLGMAGAAGFGAWTFAIQSPYFQIKHVIVEGGSPDLQRELIELSGLSDPSGYNLTPLDAKGMAVWLERHPRAKRVEVEKRYPDTVAIQIWERRPAAILAGSTSFLIDRGHMAIAQVAPGDWGRLGHLPMLTGVDESAIQLGQKVVAPGLESALRVWRALGLIGEGLADRVGGIHLAADGGVELTLRGGGTRVLLGAEPTGASLAAFEALARQQPPVLEKLTVLDLRFEGLAVLTERVAVEPKTTKSGAKKKGKKG